MADRCKKEEPAIKLIGEAMAFLNSKRGTIRGKRICPSATDDQKINAPDQRIISIRQSCTFGTMRLHQLELG